MIPHTANFYWNRETPLSYLRYLTLVTFRHHHPGWKMILWTSASNTAARWSGPERQDFNGTGADDYMGEVATLGVKLMTLPGKYDGMAPNYVSDIARWKTIDGGGWFFDLDQVIVRPFDDLCHADFVTGAGYPGVIYCGVLGASPSSRVPHIMIDAVAARITSGVTKYCQAGNWLLSSVIRSPEFHRDTEAENHDITPSQFFYPVADSSEVSAIYDGRITLPASADNYALHWFGGHPDSQRFNAAYTGAMALTSEDTISRYIRSEGIV